jgi:hypothetical protein
VCSAWLGMYFRWWHLKNWWLITPLFISYNLLMQELFGMKNVLSSIMVLPGCLGLLLFGHLRLHFLIGLKMRSMLYFLLLNYSWFVINCYFYHSSFFNTTNFVFPFHNNPMGQWFHLGITLQPHACVCFAGQWFHSHSRHPRTPGNRFSSCCGSPRSLVATSFR